MPFFTGFQSNPFGSATGYYPYINRLGFGFGTGIAAPPSLLSSYPGGNPLQPTIGARALMPSVAVNGQQVQESSNRKR